MSKQRLASRRRRSRRTPWRGDYVSLSRPRSFGQLLSHVLPDRSIIESGPPEELANTCDELFTETIAATKIACAEAQLALQAPARP